MYGPSVSVAGRAVRAVDVAGRLAVRRSAWLDKDISMRLFQSLMASPNQPRDFSLWRRSRGQALTLGKFL